MTAAEEQHLIQQVKQGNQEAYRILVERNMKRAYHLAFRLVNDHHLAEEITQESFIKAYESIGSFRGEAGFATWLHRIVVNRSLNTIKHNKRRLEQELRERDQTEFANPDLNTGDHVLVSEQISNALLELPTLQRTTVILRHVEGYSTRQVSKILGCSQGTVKTHLFRGLRKLRQSLSFLKGEAI